MNSSSNFQGKAVIKCSWVGLVGNGPLKVHFLSRQTQGLDNGCGWTYAKPRIPNSFPPGPDTVKLNYDLCSTSYRAVVPPTDELFIPRNPLCIRRGFKD